MRRQRDWSASGEGSGDAGDRSGAEPAVVPHPVDERSEKWTGARTCSPADVDSYTGGVKLVRLTYPLDTGAGPYEVGGIRRGMIHAQRAIGSSVLLAHPIGRDEAV